MSALNNATHIIAHNMKYSVASATTDRLYWVYTAQTDKVWAHIKKHYKCKHAIKKRALHQHTHTYIEQGTLLA